MVAGRDGFCHLLREPLPYGPVVDALGRIGPRCRTRGGRVVLVVEDGHRQFRAGRVRRLLRAGPRAGMGLRYGVVAWMPVRTTSTIFSATSRVKG